MSVHRITIVEIQPSYGYVLSMVQFSLQIEKNTFKMGTRECRLESIVIMQIIGRKAKIFLYIYYCLVKALISIHLEFQYNRSLMKAEN